MDEDPSRQAEAEVAFLRRLGLVMLILSAAAVLYVTGVAWLVVFASLLLAIILGYVAEVLQKYLRIPRRLGLFVAILLFVVLNGGVAYMLYPRVEAEIGRAVEEIPKMFERVRQSEMGLEIFSEENQEVVMQGLSNLVAPLAMTVNWTLQLGSFLVLVVVLAVFFALEPRLYRDGVVRAFPLRHRAEARHLLDNYGNALRLWLLGQIVAMLVVGALTTSLLLIFGMSYAFTLGLLAGLLQFVPYLGPFLWAIPAVAIALGNSVSAAVTVIGIYCVVQFFEGNLLTPVVQHKAVSLPPVLTLLATLLFGMIFGFLGLALGTPLAVVALVTYDQLYLRNTLGDTEVRVPGEKSTSPERRRLRLSFSRRHNTPGDAPNPVNVPSGGPAVTSEEREHSDTGLSMGTRPNKME